MRIDLHMHSTASDGAYSPSEVVQIALTNQMDVIALTDHDTLNGIAEAQQAAQAPPPVETAVFCPVSRGIVTVAAPCAPPIWILAVYPPAIANTAGAS